MEKTKKPLIIIFLIVLLSFFSWKSLTKPGYFSMHDDMQIMRLFQLDKCFRDGQIPCRWVPDLGYGYGYPLFNYYPPLPYYLGEFFHLAGFSLINSIKIVFALGFVLSGIFMFLFAREFWGNLGGLTSALLYIYAPYHAVDVYVRGALAEHWGLVWFPLILFSIYKIIKEKSRSWIVLLAFSYGFLLLSHNIMSMLFSLVAFCWGVGWLVLTRKFKKIIPLAFGVISAVFLAAFFIFPALLEKKFVHVETMLMGYFNYLAHFATLKQLFVKTDWGWGASVYGPDDGMPFMIGIIHWGLLVLNSILAIKFLRRKGRFSLFWVIIFNAFFFFAFAFMAHQRSTPIWQQLKFLEYLQFPWRFLGLVIFFASFSAGAVFSFLRKDNLRYLLFLLLLVALLFSIRCYFQPEYFYNIKDEDRLSGKEWQLALTNAIFDYLPIYAQYPPAEEAPAEPQIVSGSATISNFKKGTNWQELTVENISSEPAKIKLSLYDFPRWLVFVDGRKVAINHDNFLGLVTFEVNPGKHQIKVHLANTPIRTISNLLSFVSFIVLLGASLFLLK